MLRTYRKENSFILTEAVIRVISVCGTSQTDHEIIHYENTSIQIY